MFFKYKTFTLIVFVLLNFGLIHAQTFNGTVYELSSGHTTDAQLITVPFAKIYIVDVEIGTIADGNGNFEFRVALPETIRLIVSAPGYETQLVSTSVNASPITVFLEPKHIELEEVTISGSRESMNSKSVVRIEKRKLEELNAIPGSTIGESIAAIPGVYRSSNGTGISKPVIRGLQGMRVITLLNGLRLENQQWGGDHGMGVSELGIGSVEVIKGPASLLYGADAIGGVIYFRDENFADINSFSLDLRSRNESNTMGTTDQIALKTSWSNKRLSLYGSIADHADMKLPDGNFVYNSRFKENVTRMSFAMNTAKWLFHLRYSFSNSRVGIPGHSHDSVPDPQDFISTQQGRAYNIPAQVYQNHLISIENKWFWKRHELNMILGQTVNQLSEYEEKFTIPGIQMTLWNSMYTLKMRSLINEKISLIYGIQGMLQNNRNSNKATETLIPDALTADNGAFAVCYFDNNKWNSQIGIRYDVRSLMTLADAGEEFNATYQGVNYSAGTVYNSDRFTFRVNASSGFRAPHYSELLANGVHHGALRYEIGDRNLRPERAHQMDLSFEFHSEHVEIVINPYANWIFQFINLEPSDSIIDDLPVFRFIQQDQVLFYGADAGIHYHPHFAHWLHAEVGLSMISTEVFSGQNVALLPQNRLSASLVSTFNVSWKFRPKDLTIQYYYFMPQEKVAILETPTSDYGVINAGINFTCGEPEKFTLALGVKNILNASYVDHLSRLKNIGLTQSGRNFYVSLTYHFNKSLKKQ